MFLPDDGQKKWPKRVLDVQLTHSVQNIAFHLMIKTDNVSYFDDMNSGIKSTLANCISNTFFALEKLTILHLLAEAKLQLCSHPSWQQYGGQEDELYPWCHSPKALQQPSDVPVALPQPKG
jgi:hypothetical protein